MKLPDVTGILSAVRDFIMRVISLRRRERIIIGVTVLSAAFAAFVITAVVSIASGKAASRMPDGEMQAVYENAEYNLQRKAYVRDFMLYDDELEEGMTGLVLSREPMESWSREQVEEFWIDPQDIAADHLEAECDKLIRDIFADVP